MKRFTTVSLLIGLAVSGLFLSCTGNKKAQKIQLDGAGATFPFPFYNLAFKTYGEEAGATINYGAIGSGGGIRSLKDEVVDFAASDAFLSDKEMQEMHSTIHIPTCMGAVVLGYKLGNIKGLKLTGKLISDIYRGKVTRWNDPLIAAVNPGVSLPNTPITPVYRSDGSGTTNVFSTYLTQVDSDWAKEIGAGKALKWPVGIAAKGNPGVAGVVQQTEGAIGYVGSEYSHAMELPVAAIQNSTGKFVDASLASITAAAAGGSFPADTRMMITNASGADAYPISCLTWIILYKEQHYKKRTLEQAKATKQLIEWMISPAGQALAEKVSYAKLPTEVVAAAKAQLDALVYDGKSLK